MLVRGCRNGRGPQMPIDVPCPHGDDTCGACHLTGWPPLWMAGTSGDLVCHELQHAVLLFKMSSVPDARRVPCQGMCNLTELQDALVQHNMQVNAPGCCLSALARYCCISASAAAQRSVRCALLSHSSNRDCNKCNFTQFHHGFVCRTLSPQWANWPWVSKVGRRSVIMRTFCFSPVPDKGPDGARNKEKHRSWYFFRYVNQHSGKYLCIILKI